MSEYREAILSYLDVLGFSALIEQSEKNSAKINEIIELLTTTKRKGEYGMLTPPPVTQYFSDLMVRTTFIPPHPLISRLNAELMTLAKIQCELATRKILIRGGVCLKDVYRDGELLFGPALVRSYELAEKVAVVPRIIIDTHLMKQAESENGVIWEHVYKRGEDGQYFVDYLTAALNDPHYVGATFGTANELLSNHKKTIEDGLKEHIKDDGIRQKYIWMGLYHNSTVGRFAPGELALRITDEILAH